MHGRFNVRKTSMLHRWIYAKTPPTRTMKTWNPSIPAGFPSDCWDLWGLGMVRLLGTGELEPWKPTTCDFLEQKLLCS